jgi:DNA-binding transcriptional ArsR family regulator
VTDRPRLTDPAVLEALAHPVRLDVLRYLMAEGPATASVCARSVGDTPSNCSYHLRVLARHGLVERVPSGDARSRPWRATVTGFDVDDSEAAVALQAATLLRDQQLARRHLARRDELPAAWRRSDAYNTYLLRATPAEIEELTARIDALVRPLLAPTRKRAPRAAKLVHLGLYAFRRPD